MQALRFPSYPFHLQTKEQKNLIFDKLRKKFIPLTPEEWVRQHVIHLFVEDLHVPPHMVAIERGIVLGNLQKRFDLLVFEPGGKPWCLVECKAPEVAITENTLMQVFFYNKEVKASSVFVTNGLEHYWYNIVNGQPEKGSLPPPLLNL